MLEEVDGADVGELSRLRKLEEQRAEESVASREGIFMVSYRAVIQSVWKSPSDQKSGLADNQRECGVKKCTGRAATLVI